LTAATSPLALTCNRPPKTLFLEEMFGRPVPEGALYYASSWRRRMVAVDADLRAKTLAEKGVGLVVLDANGRFKARREGGVSGGTSCSGRRSTGRRAIRASPSNLRAPASLSPAASGWLKQLGMRPAIYSSLTA